MDKKRYEDLVKIQAKKIKELEKQLNSTIFFSLPELPKANQLSNQSKGLLVEYKKYLRKYKQNAYKERDYDRKLLEKYGQIVGTSPNDKEYKPQVSFKTVEQLMEYGGVERLMKYYSQLKKYSSRREIKREMYNDYVETLYKELQKSNQIDSKTKQRFFNLLNRMSHKEFYELYKVGLIPEFKQLYIGDYDALQRKYYINSNI